MQGVTVGATPEWHFDDVITQLLETVDDPSARPAVDKRRIWVSVPDSLRNEVC